MGFGFGRDARPGRLNHGFSNAYCLCLLLKLGLNGIVTHVHSSVFVICSAGLAMNVGSSQQVLGVLSIDSASLRSVVATDRM